VSKADYGGDYPLLKADYPFFPLDQSFVCCRNIVTYTDDDLRSYADMKREGALKPDHMQGLFNAVAGSEIMVQWQIAAVCNALKASF
jgi:predicted hotdog family 3-hydroxylacyl-ACP dehydratase